MDIVTLLLPIILIVALIGGLVVLKRRLFSDDSQPAPIPIPDLVPQASPGNTAQSVAPSLDPSPVIPPPRANGPDTGSNDVTLTPARLYSTPLLASPEKSIYSRLLKALPGYVVLPKIHYDQFLEARDGTASENTSLQNRAAGHMADFLICDRKMRVLLVCQVEDGSQLPARIQEREKLLQKTGVRFLRWRVDSPPDSGKLLNTVQTLEKLAAQGNGSIH